MPLLRASDSSSLIWFAQLLSTITHRSAKPTKLSEEKETQNSFLTLATSKRRLSCSYKNISENEQRLSRVRTFTSIRCLAVQLCLYSFSSLTSNEKFIEKTCQQSNNAESRSRFQTVNIKHRAVLLSLMYKAQLDASILRKI